MDADRFDAFARVLSVARARRAVLRVFLGTLVGVSMLETITEEAAGKKGANRGRKRHQGKKGRKGRQRTRDTGRREDENESSGDEITTSSHGCGHAGSACTRAGQCCTGTCLTGGVCSCNAKNLCPKAKSPCKTIVCNSTGRCVTKNRVAGTLCTSDSNPCTKDICDGNGACTHPADLTKNGTTCADDGNPCTKNVCRNGQCIHPNRADGVSCPDDGNPCTKNVCIGGQCTHPNQVNGISCSGDKVCQNGNCQCPAGSSECSPTVCCNECQDCNAAGGVCGMKAGTDDTTTCNGGSGTCYGGACCPETCQRGILGGPLIEGLAEFLAGALGLPYPFCAATGTGTTCGAGGACPTGTTCQTISTPLGPQNFCFGLCAGVDYPV